jgi:hypothetical protein
MNMLAKKFYLFLGLIFLCIILIFTFSETAQSLLDVFSSSEEEFISSLEELNINQTEPLKIYISVFADSYDAFEKYLKRSKFYDPKVIVTYSPVICSVERGIAQPKYTHICNMTHDDLSIKANITWNTMPANYHYYFKSDVDATLNMKEISRQLRYYAPYRQKIAFGRLTRHRTAPYMAGLFYGTNFLKNFTYNKGGEDVVIPSRWDASTLVVNWSTYYCGKGFTKINGYCAILVRHGKCESHPLSQCNTEFNFSPISELKTMGHFRSTAPDGDSSSYP